MKLKGVSLTLIRDGSFICLLRMSLHSRLSRWSGGMQKRALSKKRYLARYMSYSSSASLEQGRRGWRE